MQEEILGFQRKGLRQFIKFISSQCQYIGQIKNNVGILLHLFGVLLQQFVERHNERVLQENFIFHLGTSPASHRTLGIPSVFLHAHQQIQNLRR